MGLANRADGRIVSYYSSVLHHIFIQIVTLYFRTIEKDVNFFKGLVLYCS